MTTLATKFLARGVLAKNDIEAETWRQASCAAAEVSEWTTTPPSVPGWYWARFVVNGKGHTQMIEHRDDGSVFAPYDVAMLPLTTHWLGPIEVPEPPR